MTIFGRVTQHAAIPMRAKQIVMIELIHTRRAHSNCAGDGVVWVSFDQQPQAVLLTLSFWTLPYRAGNSSIILQTVYALPFVDQHPFACAFIGGSCIIDPPMPTPVENMAKDKAVIT